MPTRWWSRCVSALCWLTVVTAFLTGCEEEPDMNGTGGGSAGGVATGGGSAGGSGGAGGAGGGSTNSACQGTILVISADTTWSGALTVDCTVLVSSAATLTIAPGAAVRLGGEVRVAGSLRIDGTAASPVTVTRAGATPWGPITLEPGQGGARVFSLKHVTFTGGGEATPIEMSRTMGAALVQQADNTPLLVDTVTVDGASGIGVVVQNGAFAAGSTGLTVKNSGSYAMFVTTQSLGSIPIGSYAQNGKPAILTGTGWRPPFSESSRITTDTTIKKLDAPYVLGTGTYTTSIVISTVQSGPPTFATTPLVTIEPGVELKFAKVRGVNAVASKVNIDSAPDNGVWKPLGALRAVGTMAQPITFTSAEATPAPGDWATIALEELDARTTLDRIVIAYAGANAAAIGACPTGSPSTGSDKDGDAALQQFMNTGAPNRSPLTNSVVRDSAGGGVYRAFTGTDVDFTATNTFTNIAWCRQTPVVLTNGCFPMMCN
ncbi:MAG: hypothetical protein Q8S33_12345 [Myxococcales bacterium]|nr:hypothetical protein [Myxococcales bacterium]